MWKLTIRTITPWLNIPDSHTLGFPDLKKKVCDNWWNQQQWNDLKKWLFSSCFCFLQTRQTLFQFLFPPFEFAQTLLLLLLTFPSFAIFSFCIWISLFFTMVLPPTTVRVSCISLWVRFLLIGNLLFSLLFHLQYSTHSWQ